MKADPGIKVYLSLGTNIGNREENLQRAIFYIRDTISNIAISKIYETQPLYLKEQPKFLNCVVYGYTILRPLNLLTYIQSIENTMGRDRTMVPLKGPRIIDIDILLYENEIIQSKRLHVPHPGMYERQFVLMPLLDLDPGITDPLSGRLFSYFLDRCEDQGISVYLNEFT